MLTTIIAGTLSIGGVGCLFYSWRQDRRNRTSPLIWLGWILLISSIPLWFVEAGWEFGLVYGLSFPALIAWLVIFFVREQKSPTDRQLIDRQEKVHKEAEPVLVGRAPWINVIGHLGVFLATVPLLGAASIPVTLFLVKLLPTEDATQMLWALLIMPLLWGAIATWMCGSKKIWVPVIATLLSGALTSLYLYL